jgi:hypothetical protein
VQGGRGRAIAAELVTDHHERRRRDRRPAEPVTPVRFER